METKEEKIKEIKLHEIFTIEGKKYIVTLPKNDNHLKMTNGHGHIICPLHEI